MRKHLSVVFLLPVFVCLVRLNSARPGVPLNSPDSRAGPRAEESPHISLGHLKIKLFPFPHLLNSDGANTHRRVGSFFPDNPLNSVKRSFQDIQINVERSMQSLLAAGSAIGQRMLGIITRSPRVLLSSSPHQQVTVRPTTLHHGETFPDFNNCDCHFGGEDPGHFHPYTDQESYGAPSAPVITQPLTASPIEDLTEDVYENTIDGEPIIKDEPVIHPGGSQDVDYQKVQTIGVASVVQAASAKVPDQEHPEKYLNHNHNVLVSVVEHNLWRKETKQFKHHHHGEKLKVIPHLAKDQ